MSSLDSTLGVLELGGIFSTLLFGITTVQTFNSIVTILAIRLFEFVHTILVWHGIYSMTVTFYGQPEHLANPPPTLALTLVSETIIVAVVQLYFINRIRLVSKKWFLPALCSILTLFRFGACVAMLAVVLINANLFILSERFRWLMCASLGSGTGVDVLVTTALCYHLWQARASRFRKQEGWRTKLLLGPLLVGLMYSKSSLTLMEETVFSNSMLVRSIVGNARHPRMTP
ncbi:hypothetical protein K438DRAFT_1749940 [Mycena galopus ATCC 62051]|nr:hypothetical protein K438DRAFT_1749940 [Mycena galopus ATCC 62051]